MGKSGGGGGGAGKINIPQALGSNPGSLYYNAFQPLGTFGSQTLSSLGSLYNWATDIATGGNVGGIAGNLPGNGTLWGGSSSTYAPFTGGGNQAGVGGASSLLGPILGGEYSALGGMGQTAADLSNATGGGTSLLTQGQNILSEGNKLVKQATTGSGLFPSQQAMIDQAVQSQQAATQQQLGNMGLGSSTVATSLAGQAKMSGAAAAGQLVQGNLQLGEEEQQLGVQAQTAGAQINEALYNEYSGIAQLSQSFQGQMYNEALQGMGALGSMYNATLGAFGYSMKTQEDVLAANTAEANLQTEANLHADTASQQGFSSMMGGLGSLFGSSGSGGILGIGGTGGLFGSSGILSSIGSGLGIGGSAAGAAGGAAAGAGGSLGGIISAIGAIFACQIAQTVYGLDDERWLLFRHYLLFRAPRPLRRAYVRNASRVSALVRQHEWLKTVLKWLMSFAIWYDKETRTA